MPATSETNPCTICGKPGGIFTCDGCRTFFCAGHHLEHRLKLERERNRISQEHDLLQRNFKNQNNLDDHSLFTHITSWETHSIAQIRTAAEQTRTHLRQFLNRTSEYLVTKLSQFNDDLETSRQTDQYTELNLKKWTQQLDKLRQEILDMSILHLEHDKSKPHIRLIKLGYRKIGPMLQIDNNTDEEIMMVPGEKSLAPATLPDGTFQEEKQRLGERLFPLVLQIQPNLASKITGMLLEMDNNDILIMIRSHKALRAKVKEATAVLVYYFVQHNRPSQ